jgi:hypothetical protein
VLSETKHLIYLVGKVTLPLFSAFYKFLPNLPVCNNTVDHSKIAI